jgi:hypothetical protein
MRACVGHKTGKVVQPRHGDVDDPRPRAVDHCRVVAKLALRKDRDGNRPVGPRLDLFLEEQRQRLLQVSLGRGMGQLEVGFGLRGNARKCECRNQSKGFGDSLHSSSSFNFLKIHPFR